MRFLVQKINNKVVHDFSFTLERAKEYYDWRGDEKLSIRYLNDPGLLGTTVRQPDNYIPVGSVDFVSAYLRQFYPMHYLGLRPLNVPECLFPYADRKIVNCNSIQDLDSLGPCSYFVKSNARIKHPENGYAPVEADISSFIGRQVSEVIPIDSEWRVFVFHGEIRHMANYSGDCMLFPDADSVRQMVRTYGGHAPVAYTLDVGVCEGDNPRKRNKTFVIECHRFFSCGLYGFSDLAVIPKMLSQAWFEIKRL